MTAADGRRHDRLSAVRAGFLLAPPVGRWNLQVRRAARSPRPLAQPYIPAAAVISPAFGVVLSAAARAGGRRFARGQRALTMLAACSPGRQGGISPPQGLGRRRNRLGRRGRRRRPQLDRERLAARGTLGPFAHVCRVGARNSSRSATTGDDGLALGKGGMVQSVPLRLR